MATESVSYISDNKEEPRVILPNYTIVKANNSHSIGHYEKFGEVIYGVIVDNDLELLKGFGNSIADLTYNIRNNKTNKEMKFHWKYIEEVKFPD